MYETPRSLNNMTKQEITRLHSLLTQLTRQEILGMLDMRWWLEFDQTLSQRGSLACETSDFLSSQQVSLQLCINYQIGYNPVITFHGFGN